MSKLPEINILISFANWTPQFTEFVKNSKKNKTRIMIDSGAFTVFNVGKVISVDQYCEFLDRIEPFRPFDAITLDEPHNWEKTYENYREIRKRGFKVLPVFTRGTPLKLFSEYYEDENYVALGGIKSGGKNRNYLKWISESTRKHQVHWLGFTKIQWVRKYRPFSVDSSSWSEPARYGNFHVYRGYGRWSSVNKKVFKKKTPRVVEQCGRRVGLTPKELNLLSEDISWVDGGKNNISFVKPEKSTALFMSAMADVVRCIDCENNLKTRHFIAVSNPKQFEMILSVRKELVRRNVI